MASRTPSSSPDSATGSGTDPARPDTGDPLGGGSDSDSDLGLGKFDCGAGDPGHRLEGEELEHEFEAAADRLRDLLQTASREQLLYLYARYKQVKVGKCNTAKPGFFDFEGQRKWTAWKQLEDMSAEQAMQEYVSCVTSLDPDSSQKERRERRTGFGGPTVSSLYQEEMIRVVFWMQGGVLDAGWCSGCRVVFWTQGGVLDAGWCSGRRVVFWTQGGVLDAGWCSGCRVVFMGHDTKSTFTD
ncbi:acyl-CoA-binding domain-containing protein 6 isoform X3 [Salmo trutta]|uniref:acyl-CoA-binding domain-containing protein 6 isoform X3 n=1 Tax=Salmo trutta TaxID=8032 RepID=UPI0011305189|nr:acyl-CoA-binding domain-containing protein 6-like isoform X3 [Salmo trutta]